MDKLTQYRQFIRDIVLAFHSPYRRQFTEFAVG
jgi:hypothetical protein